MREVDVNEGEVVVLEENAREVEPKALLDVLIPPKEEYTRKTATSSRASGKV